MAFARFGRLWRRLKYRDHARDLHEEIDTHRAMAEGALRRDGMAPSEARRIASRQLGNTSLAQEDGRAVWIPLLLDQLIQDCRYGWRSLTRSRGFAVSAVTMLTIGIGLVAGCFALFNGLFLRGWNLPHSDELFLVRAERVGSPASGEIRDGISLAAYRYLFGASRAADYVTADHDYARVRPDAEGSAMHVPALFVSDNFLEVMRLPLHIGRGFASADPVPGVIISDRIWRRIFGTRSDIIGQPAWINGSATSVIGVITPDFDGLGPRPVDLVLRLADAPTVNSASLSRVVLNQSACCLTVAGRRRPAMTPAETAQELHLLVAQYRESERLAPLKIALHSTGAGDALRSSSRGRAITLALSLIGIACTLIWILTCANVGNLYLARSLRRRVEIATRLALGASRRRVVRQLLAEGLLLAGVAGTGVFAITLSVPFLFNLVDDNTPTSLFRSDWRVGLVAALATVVTSLLVSLTPALQATKIAWRSAAASQTPGVKLTRNVLLAAQIAVAAVLMLGAALLTRAIGQVVALRADYALHSTFTLTFSVSDPTDDKARRTAIGQAVAAVDSAGDLRMGLMNTVTGGAGFNSLVNHVSIPGSDLKLRANLIPMSDAAFRVLEIPLVAGRFASRESAAAEAIVNQKLAGLLWPGSSGLGQVIMLDYDGKPYTVVGIARDTRLTDIEQVKPLVHISPSAGHPYPMFVTRDLPHLRDRVTSVVRAAAPQVSISFSPLSDSRRQAVENAAVGASLAGVLGTVATGLAMLGVFSVFSYLAEERRREMSIRLALGASRRQVRAAMFRASRVAVLTGLIAGLALSIVSGQLLQSFLYGLSPLDPISYGTVALVLAVAGALATAIPIRRVFRLSPATILKGD